MEPETHCKKIAFKNIPALIIYLLKFICGYMYNIMYNLHMLYISWECEKFLRVDHTAAYLPYCTYMYSCGLRQ